MGAASMAVMVGMGMAWLAGLALLHALPRLPTPAELAALAAVLALLLRWRRRAWALVACAALIAFGQGALRAEWRLADELHPAWEGRDLTLTGRVDSLPLAITGQGGVPGWRFEFERDAPGEAAVPPRLMLLMYDGPTPTAGERWRFTVRLKRAHGLMNPGGFDAELWLFEQNLRASGVVRPGSAARLEATAWWRLDAARQRLREAIQAEVADPGMAGVLAALSLGDQNAITHADWNLFRDTGIAHLLSISGLHVALFAWLAAALIAPLWRRSRWLCLRLAAPHAARWGGVAAALGYALFAGWGVPAQRTVWMLAAVAALRSSGLGWPWSVVLLAAAVVVTVLDPWALLQPGFWLSFAAVGLLMASGSDRAVGWRQHLAAGFKTQALATVGLAPLSLVCFGQLSVIGLVANLVAVPLVSFVITPLALLGGLWAPLWGLGAGLIQGLMALLKALAGLPAAVWWAASAPAWVQAAALLGAVLIVMPLPWRLRAAGLALALPLLGPAVPRPAEGEFELLAPDVGQGNAVLVRTAGPVLLFDTGPAYAPGADAGERVLLPLLRSLGVRRLDTLVLSHRDTDHVGGAATLMQALPVGELRSSLEPGHPLLAAGVPARRCEAGQAWTAAGVRFELLHPLPAMFDAGLKPNDLSCVLRITSASGRRALLLGDLEAGQEKLLVARQPDLAAEVLLVPHHGSKTSSSPELIAAVRPQVALVQAAYRSRFGHPALPVQARYQAAGVLLVASPACGAWRWRSDHPVSEATCERDLSRRYWRDQVLPAVNPELTGPWVGEGGD